MVKSLSTLKSQFMQRSTLTYPVDHTVLESRVNAQRPFPCRDLEIFINDLEKYKIRVEIPNIQINRSTAQSQMESVKIR